MALVAIINRTMQWWKAPVSVDRRHFKGCNKSAGEGGKTVNCELLRLMMI